MAHSSLLKIIASMLLYSNIEIVVAATKSAPKDKFLYIFPENPPPYIIYIGIFIACITFLWKVGEFVYQRWERNKEKISNKQYEYWFNSVLLPICLMPLVKHIEEQSSTIAEISKKAKNNPSNKRDLYDGFLRDFKLIHEGAMDRFMLTIPISLNLYEGVIEKLEKIEDIVTRHCAANSLDIDQTYQDYALVRKKIYENLSEVLLIISSENRNFIRCA